MTDPVVFDCMVLSGGGAKGAYGAGAAKAIDVYRKAKKVTSEICYIGTSAGALNAFLLAGQGPDALITFWREASMRRILGTEDTPSRRRFGLRYAASLLPPERPFSLYDNTALHRLIRENARLGELKSPLIVAATDYTRSELRSFYRSELIDRLVAEDATRKVHARRLGHLRAIADDDMLANVLLASAAIPVFFPPVRLTTHSEGVAEQGWFIDGGVGNNTPTREAAYFYRYLESLGLGQSGTVYCVTQDPPRVFQDGHDPVSVLDIVARTLEVFNTVHTKPIVDAWTRINAEVENQRQKVQDMNAWLATLELPPAAQESIAGRVIEVFEKIGGKTPRLSAPLVEIRPSTDLGGLLDFDPRKAEQNIVHGYNDALMVLRSTADPAQPGNMLLDYAEYHQLLNRPIW